MKSEELEGEQFGDNDYHMSPGGILGLGFLGPALHS